MTAKISIIRIGKRKTCTKCGELKFLHEFYTSKDRRNYPDGYSYWCKECSRTYKREEYRRNRKKPDGVFSYGGRAMMHKGTAVSVYWGEERTRQFRQEFPTTTNADLAVEFGCSVRTIVRRAREMGLEKDPQWMRDMHNANLAKMIRLNKACPHYDRESLLAAGARHRYRKGVGNGLTHEQLSENMKKAWETRKRNMRRKKFNQNLEDRK